MGSLAGAGVKLNIRQIAELRSAVQAHAQEPTSMLQEAMKTHRILGIGENHFDGAHRAFGVSIMPAVAEGGATHFALEIPHGNNLTLIDLWKMTMFNSGIRDEPMPAG